MKDRREDRLEAEVILRPAKRGESIEQTIRAQSVDRFDPPPETQEKVIGGLKNFGFEVVAQSSNSISIAGPMALFERVFRMDPGSETLIVPREIRDQVEGVYLQRPPTYFEQ
jgi:hypothetical protein